MVCRMIDGAVGMGKGLGGVQKKRAPYRFASLPAAVLPYEPPR